MNEAAAYCVVTVVRGLDPPRKEVTALGSFDDVVAHMRATYDWFADQLADLRGDDETPSKIPVGGFGVELRNRWGSVVEVGVGGDIWFLIRREPKPAYCYSDQPPIDGCLAFWLDGWHYTELGSDELVSRGSCLNAVRRWLEQGAFPEGTGSND